MSGIRLYVFAPYRDPRPDIVVLNVLRALEVAETLVRAGYEDVFVPHLYHYWDQKFWHPHEFWMRRCIKEVERSDILVGAGMMSEGCGEEVAKARSLNIPVYWNAQEFLADMKIAKEYAKSNFGIGD